MITSTAAIVSPGNIGTDLLAKQRHRRRRLRGGVPMVYAVPRVVPVPYAEIVASVASRNAGPGTPNNIDEFTHTTSQAVAGWGQ